MNWRRHVPNISILTQMVRTMPGGLGVREGVEAAVASVQGCSPDISIDAVGLDRLVATTGFIIPGTASSIALSPKAAVIEEVRQQGLKVNNES